MDILHCDLDAFYASVEQRDNPSLKEKPVIIGGKPNSRGVVSTCSYEARKYGVHSAMPVSQAYRLCPHGVFLSPDISKYQSVSRQVFKIFYDFTPIVEPLSIDEAFLDVSGCHKLFGTALEIGNMIRKRIRSELELNISIGIAANKYLAKLATNLCKPDGIMEFDNQQIQETLPYLPVSNLWGVGDKTARSLNKAGIYTIGDISAISRKTLQNIVGSNADFLIQLSHGNDSRIVSAPAEAKSISNEITFSQDLSKPDEIEQILLQLSTKVGFRLRQSNLKAYTINLKLRTPEFTTFNRSCSLGESIDSDFSISQIAVRLYHESGLMGQPLRLTGVSCSNLIPGQLQQPVLFEEKQNQLDNIIDNLKDKFNGVKIGRASLMQNNKIT